MASAPGSAPGALDPEPSTNQLQLIDEGKQFSPGVNAFLDSIDMLHVGLDYHLISVFGSQSTGKSTLLNALFGTHFDVMSEAARRQTTKGIWMARARQGRILILDVEGTDGRERGEDQDFERKSALFALSTSEVLIVNIWEHQVGLYQGANMGLLKTVFEVNLSLFSVPNKSMLLFVIRDHIGITPLENLANTLRTDLERIWASLIKPPHFADSELTDFFSLQFTALPHKLLQPEAFASGVSSLASRFDPDLAVGSEQDYVFEKGYHRNVPVDGWSLYAANVWSQIEQNKDLDLPTQQILVARFRCDEIAAETWKSFDTALAQIDAAPSDALVPGCGAVLAAAMATALAAYDEDAQRYSPSVYDAKRGDLSAKMLERVTQICAGQIAVARKAAIKKFGEEAQVELARTGYKFVDVITSARAIALEYFDAAAADATVAEATEKKFNDERTEVESQIDEAATRLREGESKKMVTRQARNISVELEDQFTMIFKVPSADVWDIAVAAFREILEATLRPFATSETGSYDLGLGGTADEVTAQVRLLRAEAWKAFHRQMREVGRPDTVVARLREYFEERFRYDEKGVPRVWKPTDKIEELYMEALQATLKLVPLLSRARVSAGGGTLVEPDEDVRALLEAEQVDVERFGVLLSEAQVTQVETSVRRAADAMYVDAKRSTVQSIRQVPLYFYLLLLALGWNELVAVLKSPLYFTTLALVLAVVYAVYTMNLLGPIASVSNAAVRQATESGKVWLREYLEPIAVPAVQQPPRVFNATRSPAETELVELTPVETAPEPAAIPAAATPRPGQF
ncbi:RHD3/Sey1 [Limtongia smithiae]|uniref:RHD3/Sey1 n=1 Tax=Limtongia smithiae TaxID=1125753 RepID=UPI0034CFA495